MLLSLDKVGLKVALAVAFAIAAGLSDNNLVVGLVIVIIDTSSTIEPHEEIGGGPGLDLDDDGVDGIPVVVVRDANKIDRSVGISLRVDKYLVGT